MSSKNKISQVVLRQIQNNKQQLNIGDVFLVPHTGLSMAPLKSGDKTNL